MQKAGPLTHPEGHGVCVVFLPRGFPRGHAREQEGTNSSVKPDFSNRDAAIDPHEGNVTCADRGALATYQLTAYHMPVGLKSSSAI